MLLRLAGGIDALVEWVGRATVLVVLALVLLVSWNVVSRYVIGGTPVAMQELEWHLLAPIALFGMAYLMRHQGHVRVDMVYERLPVKARHALDLVSMIVGIVICVFAMKYSAGYIGVSYASLEGSPDPGGLPMRYVLKALIPAGFLLLALQCFAHAIRHAAALGAKDGD